jgi:hypothetical protein
MTQPRHQSWSWADPEVAFKADCIVSNSFHRAGKQPGTKQHCSGNKTICGTMMLRKPISSASPQLPPREPGSASGLAASTICPGTVPKENHRGLQIVPYKQQLRRDKECLPAPPLLNWLSHGGNQ